MNSKELQLIIKCGETSTVQFKECFPNQDSIAAEMVAMSNARGGMILFGIKDKTGEIIGLSYQEIQQLNSIFEEYLFDTEHQNPFPYPIISP